MFKKKRTDSKLDQLLKEGASNQKKNAIQMDKAIASTTHRLLREKIQFAKSSASLNAADQYKQAGFIVLTPEDEKNLLKKISNVPKPAKRKVTSKPKHKKSKK